MSTIDRENINKSIEDSRKQQNLSYISKQGIYIPVDSLHYRSSKYFVQKARKSVFSKATFGRKRRNKFIFPASIQSGKIKFGKNEILRMPAKENRPLSAAKFITKYINFLSLDIDRITYKETDESYLIEFLYQENYFLIEFFYDNDVVLLIRNNKNNIRKVWDFTIDEIIKLLQVIEENTINTNE
ncbi:hypothetical protein [Chryseobacterium echinoideorum]|uniref:hypothetical protein n=1 Tax=Chryseobacterium echinoideorum TaxID=1549648 RepID=UPI001186C859|nr:hypothetical protein [Chryseobacterium echinoideorum]